MQVKFYGNLNRHVRGGSRTVTLSLPRGAAVEEVLERFPFLPGEVGLVTVDRIPAERETPLHEGAAVGIFPLFAGG